MNKPLQKLGHVYSFAFRLDPAFFFVCILSGLVSSLLPYISIFFGAKIIDSIMAGNPASVTMTYVYWMVGLNLVVGLAKVGLDDVRSCHTPKLEREITRRITEKTMTLSYQDNESQETLRMIQAAKEGTNSDGGLLSFLMSLTSLVSSLSNMVYAVILLSALFVDGVPSIDDSLGAFLGNRYSALIVFAPILLTLVCSFPIVGKINKLSYDAMKGNIESNRTFGYFYNLCSDYQIGKDIRLNHLAPMIESELKNSKNSTDRVWAAFSKSFAWLQILISALYALISLVAYGYLGLKALYGLTSVGTVVSLVASIVLFSSSLSSLVKSVMQQKLSSNYLDNYFTYLNKKSSLLYGNSKLDFKKPLTIEFRHVSFHYPNSEELVLDDVTCLIKPQEKLAIVGLNGAGKTTMMKLLCRFYEPTKGEILVNGLPLSSYDEESEYHLTSAVFQDFKLFSFSVKENVWADNQGDEEKAIDCLQKVGIYDRFAKLPKGIDTVLYNKNDENGLEISGGEAQKIAFARALYKDSPLLILDEPTSALDPKSEAEVYESLGALTKDKTSLFISHRMSSTKFCDDILVIEKGKIVEEGNHASLLKIKDGLYKRMWDAQAQYYK